MKERTYLDRASRAAVRTAAELQAAMGLEGSGMIALEAGDRDVNVPIADFFAGDLRAADGESAALAAYRLAADVALRAVDSVFSSDARLGVLNERLGRNSIRLLLAKRFWREALPVLQRLLVARALADDPDATIGVALAEPLALPRDSFDGIVGGVRVAWYRPPGASAARAKEIARVLGGSFARRLSRARGKLGIQRRDAVPPPVPSVLITHDDPLVADRTVRSQPYWVDRENPSPVRCLMMPTLSSLDDVATDDLADMNVLPLTTAHIRAAWARGRRGPHDASLRREGRRALRLALRGRGPAAYAGALVYQLLDFARTELAIAKVFDVRAFVASDPHMVQSDAMAIAAEASGIPFLSYQYSNLGMVSPGMIPAADHFVLFSETFEPLWRLPSVAPKRFTVGGYVYDSAFRRVRERAEALRDKLRGAGARTIVCYFDESVQHNKFGVISPEAHRTEVVSLLRQVVERDDWAVIVKSQFEFNSPSRLYPDEPVAQAAKATGRYVELLRGDHRNIVLPCEAAMASDIAIGHLVGATASLEAALSGARSVMIDAYSQIRFRRDLYESARLIFTNIEDVLAAIDAWRAGEAEWSAIGDWAPIIDAFDPYRDGKASERLRALIEDYVRRTPPL
jgi:hypothetical protein